MKKIEITDDTNLQKPVSVQLGASEESVLQQVFPGVLECTPDGLLQSIWGSPKGNFRLEIKITNLNGLKVRDISKLLQIDLGSVCDSRIDFQVSETKTTFSVLFDPAQVVDGSVSNRLQLQPDGNYKAEYELEYSVLAFDIDRNTTQIGCISSTLKVILHLSNHLAKSYSVKLVPSLKELEYKEYSSKHNSLYGDSGQDAFIQIATLKISHSSGFRCAPSTGIYFKIGAVQNKSGNKADGTFDPLDHTQIFIPKEEKKGLCFSETNPVRPQHGEVTAEKNATAAFLSEGSETGEYNLRGLYGYNSDDGDVNEVSIPIHIDGRALKNPEDPRVDINIIAQHHLVGSSSKSKIEIPIPLKKDTNLVRLRTSVSFLDFQGTEKTRNFDFEDASNPDGMGVIDVAPIPLSGNREASIAITFKNTAETVENGHEHAGVIISNFILGELATPGNKKDINRIKTHDGKRIDTVGLFSVDGAVTKQPVVLHCSTSCENNQGANKTQVSLKYSVRHIREIVPTEDYRYSVKIDVPFTFKYYVDTVGGMTELCETDPEKFKEVIHWNTGEGILRVHLEKSMAPEWLCVDFGTSAVVALYGANATNNSLLPINKHRTDKVIPEAYPKAGGTERFDLSESSTDFLPSVIYLNNDNEGDYNACKETKDISKSAIWFSPTTGMVAGRLDYQLPSLKLMLGFDYLPDIFNNKVHEEFSYYTKRKNGKLVKLMLRDAATAQLTEICKVDVLIKNIYNQLFTYYLKPSIEEVTNQRKTQLHKLILTIPNTFTPENISMLREMIYKQIPTLHYDQIRFVSESDAVACHYLSNEALFGAERKSGTEYLLVFDMGAGTLDLTYLKRERVLTNETNRQTITIKGKMGVNKAGNYMDYMIASVIYRLLLKKTHDDKSSLGLNEYSKNKSKKDKHKHRVHNQAVSNVPSLGGGLSQPAIGADLNSAITAPVLGGGPESSNLGNNMLYSTNENVLLEQQNDVMTGSLVERIERLLVLELSAGQSLERSDNELKDYVCHKVKPLLSLDRKEKLPSIDIGIEFDVPLTVGEILDDSEFKEYIEETTSKVLDNFRAMFADEEGMMPVDTLIFSGRSTRLLDIRKGVIRYLTTPDNNPQAKNCKFADMGTMSYVDRNSGMTTKQGEDLSDGLKTAVAKGALSYVSFFGGTNSSTQMIGRNIYANYGILWNNANGWHYIDMLNRNTVPTVKAKQPTDGVFIDQYLVQKQFNFSKERVGEMMLVQTYSKDPLHEWEQHNHEMISVLVSINNCDEYNACDGSFNLELEVDESNRFIFRIGGSEVTFNPHVDFNDSALRKSIWPVLFSIKK